MGIQIQKMYIANVCSMTSTTYRSSDPQLSTFSKQNKKFLVTSEQASLVLVVDEIPEEDHGGYREVRGGGGGRSSGLAG